MRYPVDKPPRRLSNGPPYYRPTPPWFIWSHPGIDLAAPKGTTVKAPMAGKVISIGNNPSYIGGLYVIVKEDSKPHYEHYMGHLSKISVRVNQKVKEGQKVGEVGQTGLATGPHVHYQIRKSGGGRTVSPFKLYRRREK